MAITTENTIINREENLLNWVRKADKDLDRAGNNSITTLIELGKALIELQNEVKMKNRKWEEYRNAKMPYLNGMRARRAMRLAKIVEIDKSPALGFLSQRQLLNLARLTNDKPLAEKLQEKKIDTDFSLEDRDKLGTFREDVATLIKDLEDANRKGKKPGAVERLEKDVKKLEHDFDQIGNDTDLEALKAIAERLQKLIRKFEKDVSSPG